MVVAVAPSVANCLLQTSQRPNIVSEQHAETLNKMEPLYATVQRKKPRNTPEDMQQNSLERFYGGKTLSNNAAFVIQKAFRAYRLRKQFSQFISLAFQGQSEINVDTGLPIVESAPSPVPDNIDLLILQAAGLETFSSIVSKAGPSQRNINRARRPNHNLNRSSSMRVPAKKSTTTVAFSSKDDIYVHHVEDMGPSPPPRPCPALKGHYESPIYAPRPPQRTVSFLAKPTLPNKITQNGLQRPLPPPPQTAFSSSDGLYVKQGVYDSPVSHLRSYSSPAPLSPMEKGHCNKGHMVIEIPDEPLPPPPYISPPLPSSEPPSMPSPPPPPPPEELCKGQRPPCDSSSSASSIDSGFRSSCLESPTHWSVGSPNLIVSPDGLPAIKDVVFEPRPNYCHYSQLSQSSLASQRPPTRNYSITKKQVRINPVEAVEAIDEVTRRRQYRVGLNLFNQSPELGIEYLLKKNFVEYSPASVGKFLRGRKGLSKQMIGHYLCQLQRPFNLAALHCFVHEMDFTGLHLDIALRHLYQEVSPPTSEAQKVEKIIEVFAKRYISCNQMFAASFRSADTIFVLSYAIVLLNTDLHCKALRPGKRMKREDFVTNLRGADLGADLDPEMLQGIYDRIKANELKAGPDHVSQVARVEESMLKKKGQQPPKQPLASDTSRRLVCFCRLTEVPDVHKKAKAKADAHQRGVFLFNDLLVVTKTLTKKDKTQHQYRYCLDLRNLRINVFSTAQYPFGVQLQDKMTCKVAATFNARSEADQQRFVNDLQESVAEMAEMERAKSVLNDDNFLNEAVEDDAYETLC